MTLVCFFKPLQELTKHRQHLPDRSLRNSGSNIALELYGCILTGIEDRDVNNQGKALNFGRYASASTLREAYTHTRKPCKSSR